MEGQRWKWLGASGGASLSNSAISARRKQIDFRRVNGLQTAPGARVESSSAEFRAENTHQSWPTEETHVHVTTIPWWWLQASATPIRHQVRQATNTIDRIQGYW